MELLKMLVLVPILLVGCGNGAASSASVSASSEPTREATSSGPTEDPVDDKTNPAPAPADFSVEIVQMLKGTHKKRAHKLASGRVVVTEYSLNGAPPETSFETTLNDEKSAELAALVATLPLESLKSSYQSRTRAEGHLVFNLARGDVQKTVEVRSFRQPDLWKLASFVNTVVPGEHEVWYGRDGVDD